MKEQMKNLKAFFGARRTALTSREREFGSVAGSSVFQEEYREFQALYPSALKFSA
jgi:hypothetical protein